MASKSLRPWEDVAFKKQAECLALIPSAWIIPPSVLKDISLGPESDTNGIALDIPRKSGILANTELAIAEGYNARELAAKLGAGELSSEEALPFSKRAAIAQQLFNCLTETFFHRPLERARYLDVYLKEHGEPIGPLHGLPISLKDSFNLAKKYIQFLVYSDLPPGFDHLTTLPIHCSKPGKR